MLYFGIIISIHALRVEGDRCVRDKRDSVCISIHALRVEGDCTPVSGYCIVNSFLSTPSGWRATDALPRLLPVAGISIHALRVEGDTLTLPETVYGGISIHALRVEGDRRATTKCIRKKHFYPRPPGGGRPRRVRPHLSRCRFLSTPSGWRATPCAARRPGNPKDFYPRPPGGGRQAQRCSGRPAV